MNTDAGVYIHVHVRVRVHVHTCSGVYLCAMRNVHASAAVAVMHFVHSLGKRFIISIHRGYLPAQTLETILRVL